jgi:hypothetical protein
VLADVALFFPETKLFWSCLLPRKIWRFSSNIRAMEDIRLRLDTCRAAISAVTTLGGRYIRRPQFMTKDDQLFNQDGVHLSTLENDILLNNFQRILEHFTNVGGYLFPPNYYHHTKALAVVTT